ncbi:MAG: PDZ domain-containing protein [Alistipes indistinctus]
MLGVTFQEINDAFIEQRGKETGINEKGGVYVVEVDPEGAAHAAGIRKGDVIIGIQELSIDNSSKLLEEIAKHRPNDKVTVKIKRGSNVKQMEVVLRNKSGNTGIVKSDVVAAIDALGGQFADISDRARKELKINGGVQVVAISGDGVLAQARIRTGLYHHRESTTVRYHSIADLNRLPRRSNRSTEFYPDGRAVSYSIVGK